MSETEAEFAEVGFGQLVDRARIDIVGREHIVEIAETKPVEREAERICHTPIAMIASPVQRVLTILPAPMISTEGR
jgi:hypothetical protein